jgi:predicted DNA-binding transcriptional regulator YafY
MFIAKERAVRRADRLFQIIQILRRSRRPVTASQLATELESVAALCLPRHR